MFNIFNSKYKKAVAEIERLIEHHRNWVKVYEDVLENDISRREEARCQIEYHRLQEIAYTDLLVRFKDLGLM